MPYYIAEIRLNKTGKNVRKERKMGKRLTNYLVIILLVSTLILTPIMIVPAAVGGDDSDQSDLIRSLLEQLADDISNTTQLPFEAFEHEILGSVEGKRGALVNKISAVINQIESGAYGGALDKLKNDIQKKILQWLEGKWETELFERVDEIISLIEGVPVASFTFTPITPIAGETVTFNASSSYDVNGYIVSYTWDFGDGNITSVSSPIITHIYATYGTYEVTLTVTDNDNLTDTESKDVVVIAPPTAYFTYSPLAPAVDDVVTFDASGSTPNGGTIVCYEWDFGDNSAPRYGKIVKYSYDKAGTYEVVLNVTDDEGLWDLYAATIEVSTIPRVPYFSISASRVSLTIQRGRSDSLIITVESFNNFNQPVDLAVTPAVIDGVTSTLSRLQVTPPPNDTVTSVLTISANATATVGNYSLTVTGRSGLLIDDVNIALGIVLPPLNLPPVAEFRESKETVLTGEMITFNANTSDDLDGTIVSYFWNFGDNTNDTGVTTSHSYADDGTYTVTLTVTDDDGATDSENATKTVLNRPPVAIFTESAETVDTGDTITFNAGDSHDLDGTISSYSWDFGDETSATGATVNHAYEDDGVYTVTLTVTDDDGATASTDAAKTVLNRPPVALFTENETRVKTGEAIQFNASESYDPDGSIVSYFWDFGDNATEIYEGENLTDIATHTYAKAGNYTVTLTVTDDDGASSSLSAEKIVEARVGLPWALFAAVGLGIAALVATVIYLWYRRRKRKGTAVSATTSSSKPPTNPVVTLYIPTNILAGKEEKRR